MQIIKRKICSLLGISFARRTPLPLPAVCLTGQEPEHTAPGHCKRKGKEGAADSTVPSREQGQAGVSYPSSYPLLQPVFLLVYICICHYERKRPASFSATLSNFKALIFQFS